MLSEKTVGTTAKSNYLRRAQEKSSPLPNFAGVHYCIYRKQSNLGIMQKKILAPLFGV
jgi:hypothetical protein